MKALSWRLYAVAYLVAYLTTVLGTALSIFLWAAPMDSWPDIWRGLLWKALPHAVPLACILRIAWNKRRQPKG
ncbi:MAG: hypothetical protein GXD23_14075 [Comamonadaceae bacterium]|jgi:hypothetical protein|uniref:hypothetical protein n=1 Tax=Hydrogenophaga TaxID=47420 RepID=UPI0011C140B5|nr:MULTISPECIES: hypothetical protein [Hydrogenophaga]NCT98492.1 hypothetical protein [Comamonadaceae bacterium]WQB85502.1 hypothetical protein SOM08_09290 [Hydrogenophaga sp. SNF1]